MKLLELKSITIFSQTSQVNQPSTKQWGILPDYYCGLSIVNPDVDSSNQYNYSKKITATIINLIQQQAKDYSYETFCEQIEANNDSQKEKREAQTLFNTELSSKLPIYLNVPWKSQIRKDLQIGLPLFLSLNMVVPFTKGFKDAICRSLVDLRLWWYPK